MLLLRLGGLYIQIEANKRRILIINSGNRSEMGKQSTVPRRLSCGSHNYRGASGYGKNDPDSEEQNLRSLLPSARPEAGNGRPTGLCSGEELPSGCLTKEYIRDTNHEKESCEEFAVW
jgi:hypothetical protein